MYNRWLFRWAGQEWTHPSCRTLTSRWQPSHLPVLPAFSPPAGSCRWSHCSWQCQPWHESRPGPPGVISEFPATFRSWLLRIAASMQLLWMPLLKTLGSRYQIRFYYVYGSIPWIWHKKQKLLEMQLEYLSRDQTQVLHLGGTSGLTAPLVTNLLASCPSIQVPDVNPSVEMCRKHFLWALHWTSVAELNYKLNLQELNIGWTNLSIAGVEAVVTGIVLPFP